MITRPLLILAGLLALAVVALSVWVALLRRECSRLRVDLVVARFESSRLESALGDQNLAVEGWQKAAAEQAERSRRAQEEAARISQRAADRVARILAEPMPRTPDEARAWAIRKAHELNGEAR